MTEGIKGANQAFMDAFNKNDATALAALYTEDALLMPPNREFVAGRQDIQAFWQQLFGMGITEVRLKTLESEALDDLAIEVCGFTLHERRGQALTKGKAMVMWRRHDGGWKLHRHIFNSNI